MSPTLSAALLALAAPPSIDRSIGKEPAYQSPDPTYCLLTFGPDAKDRVWLVRDGDALVVDRNGNDDLTEPGERITSTARKGYEEWGPRFEVPTLTVGGRTHANLSVGLRPLKLYADLSSNSPALKAAAKADPGGWVADLSVDVDSPRFKGGQPGGRLFQMAGVSDLSGVLRFAARPADAPVVRLDGPLEVTFYGQRPTLRPGKDVSAVLCVGTPGVGGGTFAMLGYEDVIPPAARPVLNVTYPGGPEPTGRYELTERCCTVNLYGPVRAPADAPAGEAMVVASMPGWPAGAVAPTTHRVAVATSPVAPAEPLSPKLVSILPHARQTNDPVEAARNLWKAVRTRREYQDALASVVTVRFTPDGRLFAAGYPSGVVQLLDPATGKELQRVETPRGYRGSAEYAHPTPDFRRLYVDDDRDKFIPADKAKGTPARREYDGGVLVWDLTTGEPLPPIRPGTPSGVLGSGLSPDGSKLVTVERPSYKVQDEVLDTTFLRDLSTGTVKALGNGYGNVAFTPDGRTLAVALHRRNGLPGRLTVLDPAIGGERWGVEAEGTDRGFSSPVVSPDGKLLAVGRDAGRINRPGELWVYDIATGAKVTASPSGGEYPYSTWLFSPDGRWLVGITYKNGLTVWDTATWKPTRTFAFDKDQWASRSFAFSRDGTRLAVPVARTWDDPDGDRDREEMPHTRVYLFNPASDAPPEVLVGPRGYVGGAAFAPDGRTLAVGGAGGVAIYDLSRR